MKEIGALSDGGEVGGEPEVELGIAPTEERFVGEALGDVAGADGGNCNAGGHDSEVIGIHG